MTPRSQPGAADNYGFVRAPRVADLMKADHDRFVECSRAAERAGDAAAALEFQLGVPMFARGAHTVLLRQLAPLAAEMTPWMWARWAVYQCTRAEEMEHELGLRVRTALKYVLDMFYVDRLVAAHRDGQDWMPVVAQLLGQSWLFHQLCTYEFEGLPGFLEQLATGDVLEHSELVMRWVDAPMGGYRVRAGDGTGLVVEDLATGGERRLLDLGAAVPSGVDGTNVPATDPTPRWAIGRLVPSGTEPALMFDTRPVAVDERTAREVAESEGGAWVGVVDRAIREGRLTLAEFESEDRELVTDVPSLSLVHIATPPQALQATLDQLARGRDEVGRAAYKILRQVAEDRLGAGVTAPVVAAAVLQPHAYAEAQRTLATCSTADRWRRWADLVPEPARSRFLGLAATTSLGRTG